jgi:6-phosphogluconolactonase
MGMARRLFLDKVGAPRGNVHAIPTDAIYPEGAANLYQDTLSEFYGAERLDPARPLFDLVLMGVGPDGHTASLFPGSPPLDEKERWVVGVAKAGMEPLVPRVTLTFPALASTREMLFIVEGAGKRDILRRVFSGEDLSAARAHSDGALVWLLDRAAAPEAGHG